MTEPKRLPSQIHLSEMLDYNPSTGRLTWRVRPRHHFEKVGTWKAWNTRYAGKPALAGTDTEGYRSGCLGSVGRVKAHRIIWKLIHGEEPEAIDHINHIRTDNRLRNLRAVSAGENCRNILCNRPHPLGLYRRRNGWSVRIWGDGKLKHVGDYNCFVKAVSARRKAEAEMGFHPNHGRMPA